ncbi:MAG: hypothetical protein F4X34_03360 [Chloroflexi bacterium]|nr:hypothetical protein [Chloroflexota bacterium]
MAQQTANQKQEEYSIQTADPVWLREEADRVIRFFAERLRDVGIVKEVRFTYEVHGVTGWVIAEPPDDDYRSEDPIMEAVGDALDYQKVALFDFRIINLKRITKGNPLKYYVPPEAETLWKRKDA